MNAINVHPDGTMSFVWSDDMAALAGEGDVTMRRVSNVEWRECGWCADLAPVGGPVLGPFGGCRQAAIEAEVAWLRQHGF